VIHLIKNFVFFVKSLFYKPRYDVLGAAETIIAIYCASVDAIIQMAQSPLVSVCDARYSNPLNAAVVHANDIEKMSRYQLSIINSFMERKSMTDELEILGHAFMPRFYASKNRLQKFTESVLAESTIDLGSMSLPIE
jgi:hypothetical protein